MDVAALVTAVASLITAGGGVVAIVLTRQKVKIVDAKVDEVHQLVNSRSEDQARYQVELINALKAKGIDVPVNEHP